MIQLYRVLHPEDKKSTEKDIENITINNVLTTGFYNDLGFKIRDKLLILMEAQSTWTENIAIRVLLYLAQEYQNYITETEQNVYATKKLKLPKPEMYVIYTGNKKIEKEYLSLKEIYWEDDCALDAKIKVITGSGDGDIINQYITFAKICDEQRKKHGRTQEAIDEIIRICNDKSVLKEYLASREKEVKTIMFLLYNEEEIRELELRDKIKKATKVAKAEGKAEGIAEGIVKGKAEGKAEGRAEGRAEGKAEGKAEGIAEGIAEGKVQIINQIVKNSGMKIEAVIDMMGVSGKEREKYIKMFKSKK